MDNFTPSSSKESKFVCVFWRSGTSSSEDCTLSSAALGKSKAGGEGARHQEIAEWIIWRLSELCKGCGASYSLGAGRGNKTFVCFLRTILKICLLKVNRGSQCFAASISEGTEKLYLGNCAPEYQRYLHLVSHCLGKEVLLQLVQYLSESAVSITCNFLMLRTC